ncbi:MAG: thioredoxin [Cyanothece sp. SIO1E1]|nr:thioredoxin [Cyanothece sp. SIO1E1]
MLTSISEETFTKEVLGSSTPVLVHFWAPWCGLCKMINPLLNRFQTEWEGDIKLVGINADRTFRLANLYQLKTLPTLLFFEGGQVLHRLEGVRGRDDLRLELEALMSGWQGTQATYASGAKSQAARD